MQVRAAQLIGLGLRGYGCELTDVRLRFLCFVGVPGFRDVRISYDPKVYISDAPGMLDALAEGYFVHALALSFMGTSGRHQQHNFVRSQQLCRRLALAVECLNASGSKQHNETLTPH